MDSRDVLLGKNLFHKEKTDPKNYEHCEIMTISDNGTREWRLNGEFHRSGELPAREDDRGNSKYYKHGRLHREEGPAFIRSDGYKEWRINGKKHRTDGPAVLFPDGRKEWWIQGKLEKTEYRV